MNAQWHLAWYNLIFSLPFGMAALYLLLYSVSGVTFGDPDADADADADGDAHHGPTVGTGHAGGRGLAGTGPHGGDGAAFYLQALSWFGVGRVPVSILLMFLFFLWGACGLCTNLVMQSVPLLAEAPYLVSLPLAAVASVLLTRSCGSLVARLLPSLETYVQTRAALVGRGGDVMFRIDDKFGMAFVRDSGGDGHQVACRVYSDAPPIEKGQRVLLVDYNSQGEFYFCIPSDVNV